MMLTVARHTEASHRRRTKGRVRKEKGQLLDANDLDIRHDFRLLRRSLHGPHLHDWNRHRCSNHLLQGSHCHCQRSQPSPLIALDQELELVLACDYHVLPLRRECHLLLQAHCARGQGAAPSRYPPSLH